MSLRCLSGARLADGLKDGGELGPLFLYGGFEFGRCALAHDLTRGAKPLRYALISSNLADFSRDALAACAGHAARRKHANQSVKGEIGVSSFGDGHNVGPKRRPS